MVETSRQSNDQWLYEYDNGGSEMADMSKYASGDSSDLKAKDFIGKNLKVVISEVSVREYPASEEQAANSKPVLSFEGKEKVLVLNATNTKVLCAGYGSDSDDWIGKEIGLAVVDYTDKGYGHGWVVTPLDLPPPDFDDEIPFQRMDMSTYGSKDAPINTELIRLKHHNAILRKHWQTMCQVKQFIFMGLYDAAHEAFMEIEENDRITLYKAPASGGFFTTEERQIAGKGVHAPTNWSYGDGRVPQEIE